MKRVTRKMCNEARQRVDKLARDIRKDIKGFTFQTPKAVGSQTYNCNLEINGVYDLDYK